MPSPPLVPGESLLDLTHLRRMTLGQEELEHEVLSMFFDQTLDLMRRLDAMPSDAGMLVHTLKGSARSVGAIALSDAALGLEGAMRRQSGVSDAMDALREAAIETRGAIGKLIGRN